MSAQILCPMILKITGYLLYPVHGYWSKSLYDTMKKNKLVIPTLAMFTQVLPHHQ